MTTAAEIAKTARETIGTTARDAYRRWTNGQNEGGEGYNPHFMAAKAEQAAEEAERERLAEMAVAAEDAAREAEWTPEVIAARRATWNAWAKSHRGPVTTQQVRAQEQAQGWTLADLKAAVARLS